MRYERRYSNWKDLLDRVSFTLILRTTTGVEVGSKLVEVNKPYTPTQMLTAIRTAVQGMLVTPQPTGENLLTLLLAMENEP